MEDKKFLKRQEKSRTHMKRNVEEQNGSHDMKKVVKKKIGNKIISDVWLTFTSEFEKTKSASH